MVELDLRRVLCSSLRLDGWKWEFEVHWVTFEVMRALKDWRKVRVRVGFGSCRGGFSSLTDLDGC